MNLNHVLASQGIDLRVSCCGDTQPLRALSVVWTGFNFGTGIPMISGGLSHTK